MRVSRLVGDSAVMIPCVMSMRRIVSGYPMDMVTFATKAIRTVIWQT